MCKCSPEDVHSYGPCDETCDAVARVDFDYPDETGDGFEEDGPYPGEECGRWNNGKFMQYCPKAGSEECDWECPYSR